MRVLCVSPYYEPAYLYGGPARSVPTLCKALARQDVDVTVFTTNASGRQTMDVPTEQSLDREGVQVVYFPRRSRLFFWTPSLARACTGQVGRFDVVHVNGMDNFPSLVAASAALAHAIAFVLSPRGTLMPWALRYKRRKKALYMRLVARRRIQRAAALICADESEAEAVQRLGFTPPTYIIPNGLDVRNFADLPPRGRLRQDLQISDSAMVILAVGRLHSVKRPDLALKAFARIAAKHSNTHLIFAGPDELGLQPSLLTMAHQAGCADRVHFTGLLRPDEVLQALADADLYLNTSESENFGMAVAEAMAAGLPLVVSDRVGISRLVAGAGAGQVVPLDDKGIAAGLEHLLASPETLREIGLRARRVAAETFDLEVVAHQMIACYAEVIKERAA